MPGLFKPARDGGNSEVHRAGTTDYGERSQMLWPSLPMNPELLSILRCPETRQALAVADAAVVARLNAQVATSSLRNAAGQPVTVKLDGGLMRADGKALYPVRNNVPVLLIGEAIAL